MPLEIIKGKAWPREIVIGQGSRLLAPEPEQESRRGKKMAEEKKLGEETGVKKIHEERADKQGPIGIGAERQPEREPDADVKIGNKGGGQDE